MPKVKFSEHAREDAGPDESVLLKFAADDTVTRLPEYMTEGAAGFDIAASENMVIPRWQSRLIKTGLRLEVPRGYELQIRSRSGLAAKKGAFILNSPGTVDWDFRGELVLILANLGIAPLLVERGDRIAQGVLAPVTLASLKRVQLEDLSETFRGEGGLGSTGTK